ncbi:MAG: alanine dehydrogenase, partial [Chlamydiia bacterium]|nr:alanine dehydrogenase [Chlamydiia bacterium]
ACARTSTQALTNAIAPYVLDLAEKGYRRALKEDVGLKEGLNVCLGQVTNQHVAHDCGYKFHAPDNFL